jgi:hypothetical protein
MHIAKDVDAAAWIPDRLHPFAQDVAAIIPAGFAAYARVFHPPYLIGADGTQTPVRWGDIAAANGRSIADEMNGLGISSEPSRHSSTGKALWDQQPSIGSLPREVASRLAAILPAHTTTADSCWFAVWEGFGDLNERYQRGPRFSVPHRDLFLLHGSVGDVLKTLSAIDWSYRSPNLWWPEDRAWCVATEIDFTWTYVGGSAACIEQVLSDPELEALPTHGTQGNSMEK